MSKMFVSAPLLTSMLVFPVPASSGTLYLNVTNIDIVVGPGTTATSANNTFDGGRTIDKVIDAPSADAEEYHDQTTHIWYSGGSLELLFDLRQEYDVSTLHFWNYTAEAYDVDAIAFQFFNTAAEEVGNLTVKPALGTAPGITAEDISLPAPLNVRYIVAVLTGTNDQIDFQNIGFSAELSEDQPLLP